MNNKLQNGCFGNFGHEQCLVMGCIPNSGIHTFTETCAEGNAPCPYPYHLESNGGSISFNCPDQLAEDHCVATFGPNFHMSPCLELGCVLTDDSTYEEWCVSSEEVSNDEVGIGSVCPSDCYLQNHKSVSSILFALIKKPRICAPLLLVQISLLTNVFTWDVTFQRTQLTKNGVKVVRAATQM